MPRKTVPASDAARQLGISLDTLRRWDRQGRIRTERDRRNRRLVPASEIDRLRGGPEKHDLSARNRLRGRIREVRIEGLLAQVELDVNGPARVVAVITREAAEQLELAAGQDATALVKATSVMVER
jgi:molybdopterin-binding protein